MHHEHQGTLFSYDPAGPATVEEVSQILDPYRDALCRCWTGAWADWQNHVSVEGRQLLGNLARAVSMNDFVIARAGTEFAGRSDVQMDMELGFFKIYIGDRVVARFKKVNRDRLAMNVQTDQQIAWYSDEPLIGVRSDCIRVTVGYLLNPTGDAIEDICITRQLSRSVLGWQFSLLEDVGTIPIPIGFNPAVGPNQIPLIPVISSDAMEGHAS